MRKDLMKLTAVELGKKIKDKEVTVVEATKACLERIKALDETYNCFVTVDEAGALAQAEAIQAKIDSGELTGPLAGVPVAIKDNMCINGMLTSCSSKILSNFVPTYTATAVEKLQEAGAVIIGKTNMDEFAMGSTTETSYYGVTRNPYRQGTGRFFRWFGSSRCSRGNSICTWFRYRWKYPSAGRILRCDRYQADIRKSVPLWFDRVWFIA